MSKYVHPEEGDKYKNALDNYKLLTNNKAKEYYFQRVLENMLKLETVCKINNTNRENGNDYMMYEIDDYGEIDYSKLTESNYKKEAKTQCCGNNLKCYKEKHKKYWSKKCPPHNTELPKHIPSGCPYGVYKAKTKLNQHG